MKKILQLQAVKSCRLASVKQELIQLMSLPIQYSTYHIAGKFDRKVNSVVWQSGLNCQIKSILTCTTRNDVMHAVALSPPLYASCTCSLFGANTLPGFTLCKFANSCLSSSISSERWHRNHYIYDDVIRCRGATVKFKFCQVFFNTWFETKLPNSIFPVVW